jgi:hypothetical protein
MYLSPQLSSLWMEPDRFRKPGCTPHQVRAGAFGIML